MQLNRRDFLKASVPAAGLLVLTKAPISKVAAQAARSNAGGKAMLYDSSKCVGCRACVTACRRRNGFPPDTSTYGPLYDAPTDLTRETWTVIKVKQASLIGSNELLFRKYQCMHCTDAACVEVCPTGALFYNELGFVNYDKEKCSGCGYCTQYCPFNIPRLGGSQLSGLEIMGKCDFCSERVTNGRWTACAEACPTGALVFGDRNELIAQAWKRFSDIKTFYPRATFYGENELGGLHVMYLLKDSPGVYDLPDNPKIPANATVWQDVIKPLGYAAAGLVALGLIANVTVARIAMRGKKGHKEE
jgi:formate dehydrogenase iron-sulfur subunit